MHLTRRALFAAAALVSLATAPLALANEKLSGPAILTVTGAVNNPNRGAVDPAKDAFFAYQEVEFDAATEFDFNALSQLDMVKVTTDYPKGSETQEFEGPLLADILASAGADGKTVTLQALDGYAVDVPMEELVANGAVLALKRNGDPLALGGYGPTQIVFPRMDRAELADMPDDKWVWSVFHIKVE